MSLAAPTMSVSVSGSSISVNVSGRLDFTGIHCEACKSIPPPFPSITMYSSEIQSAADAATPADVDSRCGYALRSSMFAGTYSPDGGPCRGCPEGFTTIGNGAISADNCTGKVFLIY